MINVQEKFDGVLRRVFAPTPEVMRFLLNHERKELVINETKKQIKMAEISNKGKHFEAHHISDLIETCAKCFANAALNHKHEQILSHLEVQRRISETTRLDAIKEEFEADQKEFNDKKLVSRPGSVC